MSALYTLISFFPNFRIHVAFMFPPDTSLPASHLRDYMYIICLRFVWHFALDCTLEGALYSRTVVFF